MDEAIRKRAAIRSVVTKTINRAEKWLSAGSGRDDKINAEAEACIDTLKQKLGLMEELDLDIQSQMEEEKLSREQEEADEYAFRCRKYVRLLEKSLSNATKSVTSGPQVKLPKRHIPTFDGTVTSWQTYWDQFSSSIDSNNQLSDIDKFNYLLDSLSESAKSCIRGLSVTSANYKVAIDLLHQRFGKSDLVIRSLMNQLSDIHLSDVSLAGLRSFHDDIAAAVRSLEVQGVMSSAYEALLLPNLLRKCPSEFRLDLMKCASLSKKEINNMAVLLEFLQTEIQIRENAAVGGKKSSNSEASRHYLQPKSSLATLTVQSRNDRQAVMKIFCTYCGSDHTSEKCSKLVSVDARIEFLKKEQRCFRCLRSGHSSRTCHDSRRCRNCSGAHHVSICNCGLSGGQESGFKMKAKSIDSTVKSGAVQNKTFANAKKKDVIPQVQTGSTNTAQSEPESGVSTEGNFALSMFINRNPAVALPVAKAILIAPDGRRELLVRVLLDTASNRSYIREDVCDLLQFERFAEESLKVSAFSGIATTVNSSRVKFHIRKVDSMEIIRLEANVVKQICQPQTSVIVNSFQHLRDVDLADPYDPRDISTPISILVGSDQYFQIVGDNVIRGTSGPVAISSKLGFLLCGPLAIDGSAKDEPIVSEDSADCSTAQTLCCATPDDAFVTTDSSKCDLSSFWRLEALGISEQKDDSTEGSFTCNPRLENGRYSVSLPWKYPEGSVPLDDHFDMAYSRLSSTTRALRKAPETLTKYSEIISEQEASGIIEKVPEKDLGKKTCHYMPHHHVIKSDSEHTKIRIVFDGSARLRTGDFSINDLLQAGPTDVPLIPEILMRFRKHPIAIIGDIEKAFLQIAIDSEDRDYLRFLWTNPSESDKVFHYRFCRLPFGLTCSPGVLRATVLQHIDSQKNNFPLAAEIIRKDLYVDNLVTSCKSLSEAFNLYKDAKNIFNLAGMNMRQWKSNSDSFNSSLPDQDVGHTEKVLGLHWDSVRDTFVMQFSELVTHVNGSSPTKRSMLGVLASVYDPLGILAPSLTAVKVMLQKLCVRKSGWDDELPPDIAESWNRWLQSLSRSRFEVPRYLFADLNSEPVRMELHGFCDASESAYAACVYIQARSETNEVSTHLIQAKTRVAPLSNLSIARLELLGALILARLIRTVSLQFPSMTRHLWTDSKTTLQWITNTDKLRQVFVQNRVKEIRTLTSTSEWRHVPGELNPADLPSRGCLPEQLQKNKVWFSGPEFLRSGIYPVSSEDKHSSAVTEDYKSAEALSTVAEQPMESKNVDRISLIIDIGKFSNYSRVLRVLAWVQRFVRNLRSARAQSLVNRSRTVTAEELTDAEVLLVRSIQRESFSKEIDHIRRSSAATHLNRNLNLWLDDKGLLRSQGRISAMSFEVNNPILVPRHSHLEQLIIRQAHQSVAHGGVASTLSKVREKYWILKGRQRTKQELAKCVVCRKVQGRSYVVPQISQLPEFRLSDIRPFQSVGVDYCGPIFYRTGEDGCDSRKAYILLLTCSSTRAVHLELLPDMTASQFLNGLRRFVSRRGIPSIISDNAKTFKAAANILGASTSYEVQSFCANKKISWEFIPEKAPWWGGFWERLVGIVKDGLKKSIGKALLTFDELSTSVIEMESVVNSRPLMYVSADEINDVLTPAHFLFGTRLTQEPTLSSNRIANVLPLPARLKHLRRALNVFWDVWKTSYVTALREKALKSQGGGPVAKPGDVVLVQGEPHQPRLQWKMGVVESVREGRNGAVRSAIVRLAKERGSRGAERIRRPVQALIPLELCI